MCAERAVAYFEDNVMNSKIFIFVFCFFFTYVIVFMQIQPELALGNNVLIAAHGNSLRSIIMYLDKLTSQEVTKNKLE